MGPTNFEILTDACKSLVSREFNDFWVCGGLTDYSFEEGERSKTFKNKVVERYRLAGMPNSMISSLRNGVNGNLKELIERSNPGLSVLRNMNRGQDLNWPIPLPTARVEVKKVFDCTFEKFYCTSPNCVTKDLLVKLPKVRKTFSGDLFSVVFFLQLPEYQYPKGWSCGRRITVFPGIKRQFANLTVLGSPLWRSGPSMLDLPGPGIAGVIEDRFRSVHRLPPIWRFDVSDALRDAAVEVCIWQLSS